MGGSTSIAILGFAGLAIACACAWLSRRAWARRRALATVAALAGAVAITLACALLWLRFRPWPEALDIEVAPGIRVTRYGTHAPRPLLVSVAEIDLSTPGLEIVTTPVEGDGEVAARTTRQFADAHATQVAVNAQFFTPFWSKTPWDFYPREGDRVAPLGLVAADGDVSDPGGWFGTTVWFSRDGVASLERPDREARWDAITGRYRLLADGEVVAPDKEGIAPRVALGLDLAKNRMWLVVVDGRQPGYAEGVTLRELAEIVRTAGAREAVELDGGGSAAMAIASEGSPARLVNTPIHTRVPGRERPVATHLGVRIGPGPTAS
jgi:hypothetical protein